MSILTIALILVVVLGLIVSIGGRRGGVETYTISTRELPNVATDLGARDVGTPDTDRARR